MTATITIDSAGRIVLPSDVRRRLNLTPGTRLALAVVAEHIELTPETDADDDVLAQSGSRRAVLRATGQPFDAAAAVRADRETQAGRGRRR